VGCEPYGETPTAQSSGERMVGGVRERRCSRLRVQGSEKGTCGRGGGQVPDKLRGEEVLCLAGLCNMEAVDESITEGAIALLLLISASAPAVCGHAEEHFEVSCKQGSGYGRRKKLVSRTAIFCGLTNGECRRAFSQKLQVTLVMQAGLPRTNMYSHARKILAYRMCWGGSRHHVFIRALSLLLLLLSLSRALSVSLNLSPSLSRSLARSLSLPLAHPLNTQVTTYFVNYVYCTELSKLKCVC